MRRLIYILLIFVFVSCDSNEEKIKALEGYWNIDEVILPNGSEREFPFSNHMDHFEVDGFNGVKNRVSPTYDGGFINYGNPIYFQWEEKDGDIWLTFQEGEASYMQTVETATKETLVLLHENGTRYTYKAYTPNEEQ
ncbi:lipocalin family protein [Nonlabens sp.]|jgi:hypothetical protein|uniref:lipocalin family protein n=1 Tax=Nonlabens sp. TaxID=1888209 RepID=UPI003F69C947